MPAPDAARGMMTAFDLNVKSSDVETRDAKGLSFLSGVDNGTRDYFA